MASPMASMAELTVQVVALTDQVKTLTMRVAVAEEDVTMSGQGPRMQMSGDIGIFDKKKGIIYTGNFSMFGTQLIGACALFWLSVLLSFAFFYPLKKMGRLRLTKI